VAEAAAASKAGLPRSQGREGLRRGDKAMNIRLFSAAAMAAMLLGGCAYDHRDRERVAVGVGAGDYYDGYYDGYYGPFNDGYWGNDGFFYYSDGNNHWLRDSDHHFHHNAGNGWSHVHGSGHHRDF
jgi:hypothetical protein